MPCCFAQFFGGNHRHHADGHQSAAPGLVRFADGLVRHPKLEQPALHSVEVGFRVDAQGDGVRPLRQSSWGALAGSVDELRCKNSAREIAPDDAEVA